VCVCVYVNRLVQRLPGPRVSFCFVFVLFLLLLLFVLFLVCFVWCVCVCVCFTVVLHLYVTFKIIQCVCLCASTTTEMRRTERGRVLASPETPNASSALAVGSYQNFSQFLAALEEDRYPGKRVIFLT